MKALLLVDLQNDFLPGGALPVPQGDEVIPIANRLMDKFELVIATKDWHPADHQSFAAMHPMRKPGDNIMLHGLPQTLWPIHCVQNSHGAAFAERLNTQKIQHISYKGTHPETDSYSGFFDNGHRTNTGLDDYLRLKGVTALYVMGLATDYCVKFTVLDALQLGHKTFLISDACRGVNLHPDDSANALLEMQKKGAVLVSSEQVLASTN